MLPAVHPSLANARAHTLVLAMLCAAGCLPSRDLSDYSGLTPRGPDDSDGLTPSAPDPGATAAAQAPDAVAPNEDGEVGVAAPPLDAPDVANESPGASTEVPGAVGTSLLIDAGGAGSLCAADEALGPDGHCYFFDLRTLTWDAARSACQARGSGWDLGSVQSAAESRFLGDTLAIESWIGASDGASEGRWVWVVDDQPFWLGSVDGMAVGGAYVNWNATEPNGAITTNCARSLPRSSGSLNADAPWADLACGELRGAVCEAYPVL